jgi:hypothetical protein
MSETREMNCPECTTFDRRDLLRYVSIAPAAMAAGAMMSPGIASAEELPMPREFKANPGGSLVQELYASMSDEQKTKACKPWTHQARLSVNPNKALDKTIGNVYNAKQQELIERIVKSISAGDDRAWTQITRGGTWDASKTFANTGADIFGDPTTDQYAFLFTGHHLTLRLDNNLKDGVAFGGPIYYGHTPNPYSDKNVFYYQTQQAMKFFDALNNDQREKATINKGNPGEGAGSIKLPGTAKGVLYADLSADQKELMEKVMHALLSPFRKEDADEAMAVIKVSGGLAKLGFAFYGEGYEGAATDNKQPWSFWRIEGPGFVWNFRVLPHVHTYVNIMAKA